MSARDELAKALFSARRPGGTWNYMTASQQMSYLRSAKRLEHSLGRLGYRKPSTIQYVVVTADGGVYDCSFGLDRQKAQEVADQATADAASVGLDYVYRVAELIEPEAQQ